MDLAYWKARCEAAESALARSRTCVPMGAARRAVIATLADLKPGQSMETGEVAAKSLLGARAVRALLIVMEQHGLVDEVTDAAPARDRGAQGRPGRRWRLAPMVLVVDEPDEVSA